MNPNCGSAAAALVLMHSHWRSLWLSLSVSLFHTLSFCLPISAVEVAVASLPLSTAFRLRLVSFCALASVYFGAAFFLAAFSALFAFVVCVVVVVITSHAKFAVQLLRQQLHKTECEMQFESNRHQSNRHQLNVYKQLKIQ